MQNACQKPTLGTTPSPCSPSLGRGTVSLSPDRGESWGVAGGRKLSDLLRVTV